MAYENPEGMVGCFAADIDMSGKTSGIYDWQFRPVWLGAAANIQGHGNGGAAILAMGSSTAPPFGVLQNAPIQGEAAAVATYGLTKIKAAGTWAVGDAIGVNGSGQAIKAGTGTFAFATAMEAATAGDISTVHLRYRGNQ